MSEAGERRARFLLVFVTAFFLVLTGRLWYLQIVHGEHYEQLAQGNRLRRVSLPAPRGNIYDAHGRLVVGNRLSFTVSLVPGALRGPERDEVLRRLSELSGVEVEQLHKGLRSGHRSPYEPIAVLRDVPAEMVIAVEESRTDLPGVLIEEEPAREYLYDSLASHVLGYLQLINAQELADLPGYRPNDLIGRTGLERAYEHWLKGEPGTRLVEVNALSRPVRVLGERPPRPGYDLYLTIDVDLQKAVEEAFVRHLEVLARDDSLPPPKAGAVVVLDPRDGAILAALSYPHYDPNLFLGPGLPAYYRRLEGDRNQPLLNRVVSGQYPPGSAFKPITAAAILEAGVIGPDDEYYAKGYVQVAPGYVKRNWTVPLGLPPAGWIDIRGALEQSSNDFFWEMGALAGIERIAAMAREFGLGSPTGLTMVPQERAGLVGDPAWKAATRRHLPSHERQWYPAETMDVAIGQGPLLVTPLQLAAAYMGLANRGDIYRPYLVRRVVDQQGSVIYEAKPTLHRRVRAKAATWQAIHEGLVRVVHGSRGTARNVFRGFPYPYTIAGKTGSAQVNGGPSHGWFAAYAPADDPQVVVVVLVEHGGGGARAAAPIARDILEAFFQLQEARAGIAKGTEKGIEISS